MPYACITIGPDILRTVGRCRRRFGGGGIAIIHIDGRASGMGDRGDLHPCGKGAARIRLYLSREQGDAVRSSESDIATVGVDVREAGEGDEGGEVGLVFCPPADEGRVDSYLLAQRPTRVVPTVTVIDKFVKRAGGARP